MLIRGYALSHPVLWSINDTVNGTRELRETEEG